MRIVAVLLAIGTTTALAAPTHEIDPQTGLESWLWRGQGLAVELHQRLPDQSRAYFQGRGFAPEDAEPIARSCIFQAIIRNTLPPSEDREIALDLARWRVRPEDGAAHPPALEEDWEPRWEARQVPQAARIAFRWSLFPSRQRFAPGDWNMGMISMGLPLDAGFDLEVTWKLDGKPLSAVIPAMRCAPDRHI